MEIKDLEALVHTKILQQDKAEESVSQFYNSVGWVSEDDTTEDAKRFEDLREYTQEYTKKTRNLVIYSRSRGIHSRYGLRTYSVRGIS